MATEKKRPVDVPKFLSSRLVDGGGREGGRGSDSGAAVERNQFVLLLLLLCTK